MQTQDTALDRGSIQWGPHKSLLDTMLVPLLRIIYCGGLSNPVSSEGDTARGYLSRFGIIDKTLQDEKEIEAAKADGYSLWYSRHKHDTTQTDWGQFRIPLMEFQQEGFTHHFGTIQLGLADSLCRVPSLPLNTTSRDIANRSLANRIDDYQRPLQHGKRLDGTAEFLSTGSSVVTPLILHIPSSIDAGTARVEETDGTRQLVVNLQNIAYMAETGWDVDVARGVDHRPLDLVDGQHRTRGCKLSENAMAIEIPFILLDERVEDERAGKFFAEINVQSVELQDLHKLHLRYVLAMPYHQESEDFGLPSEQYLNGESRNDIDARRYANRTAYELGARLHTEPTSPLHKRILFIEDCSDKELTPINSSKWVSIVKIWIRQQFNPNKMKGDPKEHLYQHLFAYFSALRDVARTDPNTGEEYDDVEVRDPWGIIQNPGKGNNPASAAFRKLVFQALVELFPQAYSVGVTEEPFRATRSLHERYQKVLEPLIPLDFRDTKQWDRFLSTDGARYIYEWMAWAVLAGKRGEEKPNPEHVWNPEDPDISTSNPGSGFFSGINPANFSGTIHVRMASPTELQGTTIQLTADALPNESYPKQVEIHYMMSGVKKNPQVRTQGYATLGMPSDIRPKMGIGAKFVRQSFGTSTQSGDTFADGVKIRWTAGNLYDNPVTVFEQEYTIEDLAQMNGRTVQIANSPFEPEIVAENDDISFLNKNTEPLLNHIFVEHEIQDEDEFRTALQTKRAEEPENPSDAEERIRTSEIERQQRVGKHPISKGKWANTAISNYNYYRLRPPECMHCFHGNDHKCWRQ